jgi:hypothetical protein
MVRLMSEEAIRERYGPRPNPYADAPQTLACQWAEMANAMREVWTQLLVEYVRLLRRLPWFG